MTGSGKEITRRTGSINVWIAPETADYLDLLMRRWGVSRSGAIAEAVRLAAEGSRDSH